MTPGQQRALRELRRLHAAEPDGITILGEPHMMGASLAVRISLRFGPIESARGGLELREREEFQIHIPPGFPFDRPSLTVDHERFAGFPHVTWIHAICLYRSALDWNPRDGMYGFFEKLRLWLWKAAINDMDPVEEALEPPHHVTDFAQLPFVVRANVPAQVGVRWVGFAQLEYHPNRIELTGWRELFEEWPTGKVAALAVMLPQSLPMEFPRKGEDFFRELKSQDIDRDTVIRFLACAATLSPPTSPIHLVLGLPMRRAADGSPRMHVAVWTTSAEFADALRSTLQEEGDTPSIEKLRSKLADTIYSLLEKDKIVWCRILEDRREIVARRDQGSAVAWFAGKRVLLLGCGALGSWIGEIIARAGVASIDLLDNEIVKPGILARQNFRMTDIGTSKSQALASRLRLLSAGLQCNHFAREAHAFIMENQSRFQSYDVVIDCTASSIVQMKLEREWNSFRRLTPAMISIGIDARAQRCLAVTIPANAVAGVWDAYIQLKHRLCVANTNQAIIDSFYSVNAGRDLLQPEPGCSDPTFCGSTADVAVLSATALNMVLPELAKSNVPCGIAFSSHASGAAKIRTDVFTLANFAEIRAGQYRIRVAKNVHGEARAWVLQNNRVRSKQHETGGLLWGLWDDALDVVWILDASGPPPDSKHDPGQFICGVEGAEEEHKRRVSLTRGVTGFIGMWHTHPEMSPNQSATDIAGMATLVAAIGQNQRQAIMLIYGRADEQPAAEFFVYESREFTRAGELISVAIGKTSLETAVV